MKVNVSDLVRCDQAADCVDVCGDQDPSSCRNLIERSHDCLGPSGDPSDAPKWTSEK